MIALSPSSISRLEAEARRRGLPVPQRRRTVELADLTGIYALPLYDRQREAIFAKERYAIIEASTKAGKTHGCIKWIYEQARVGIPGQNYWWVAPIVAQAKIAFRRMRRALKVGTYAYNKSELWIELEGAGTIWFKSADNPDSLYGDDVVAAVLDEASRCKEDSFNALRSTLTATQGHLRLIGNVKGRKNFFYKMARKAQAGEPNMHYARITAYDAVDAGVLPLAEIEDAKAVLPENVFRELYLAEPSDDGGNPFGLKHIEACTKENLSSLPAVAFGIDLAKSHDWTVVIGLDEFGAVSFFERWQGPWEPTIQRILSIVARYPDSEVLVDSTGVGDPILEALQKAIRGRFEGFKFTAATKQSLMEGLAVGIQNGACRFPLGIIKDELDEFEYQYTRTGVRYSAPDGAHDDCVCALALAWRRFETWVKPVNLWDDWV